MPNRLENGEWLKPDQTLVSENSQHKFAIRWDGNVAVYHNQDCVWENLADKRFDIKGVHMQEDGNLVLYTHNGEAVWATNTDGKGDSVYCIIQDDGNFVLYEEGDHPIWASGTQREPEERFDY
ncbi:bulb-type lectin domain-containing protein [Aspergillus transmontanensis]|uniref:Bulb-type lectin domain-containing protein n=1 Tax=Aspergillus transmontanensis TaxID=1034304 RepID=A0A5N6W4H0_9EURO|nr:bulb-type lectin domain-containing protein [Aspergillus transmontanensis]